MIHKPFLKNIFVLFLFLTFSAFIFILIPGKKNSALPEKENIENTDAYLMKKLSYSHKIHFNCDLSDFCIFKNKSSHEWNEKLHPIIVLSCPFLNCLELLFRDFLKEI